MCARRHVPSHHQNDDAAKFTVPLSPDTAHNNVFDFDSSQYFYQRCQELGIPLVVVSRHAAGACPVPRIMYDDIAESNHPVALRLRAAQRHSIVGLWKRACAAEGTADRQKLPARCNREWFLNNFCNGLSMPEGSDDVWSIVRTFNMYDSMALIACVPELRDIYFDYNIVTSQKSSPAIDGESSQLETVSHIIIGAGPQEHGIKEKSLLRQFMVDSFKQGIVSAMAKKEVQRKELFR